MLSCEYGSQYYENDSGHALRYALVTAPKSFAEGKSYCGEDNCADRYRRE
jgi:hypothetical protein